VTGPMRIQSKMQCMERGHLVSVTIHAFLEAQKSSGKLIIIRILWVQPFHRRFCRGPSRVCPRATCRHEPARTPGRCPWRKGTLPIWRTVDIMALRCWHRRQQGRRCCRLGCRTNRPDGRWVQLLPRREQSNPHWRRRRILETGLGEVQNSPCRAAWFYEIAKRRIGHFAAQEHGTPWAGCGIGLYFWWVRQRMGSLLRDALGDGDGYVGDVERDDYCSSAVWTDWRDGYLCWICE